MRGVRSARPRKTSCVPGAELREHGIEAVHHGVSGAEPPDGRPREVLDGELHQALFILAPGARGGLGRERGVQQPGTGGCCARLVVVHGETVEVEPLRARKGDSIPGERLGSAIQHQVDDGAPDIGDLREEGALVGEQLRADPEHVRSRNRHHGGLGASLVQSVGTLPGHTHAARVRLERNDAAPAAHGHPLRQTHRQRAVASLEALEPEAAQHETQGQEREGAREALGIAVEGGGQGGLDEPGRGLLPDAPPQVGGQVFDVQARCPLWTHRVEHVPVTPDVEQQSR
jgi:hypothetical protein